MDNIINVIIMCELSMTSKNVIKNVLGWCISIRSRKEISDKKKKFKFCKKIQPLYNPCTVSIVVLYS